MKGIKVRNSQGYTQIDARYKNTAFINKGTVSGTGYLKIPVPADCAIALRPSCPCMSWLAAGTNGGTTLNIRIGPHRYWTRGTLTVDYYIFGPPEQAKALGTKGIRIRREDGSIAFDSRLGYMNVLRYEAPPKIYPNSDPVSPEPSGYDPVNSLIHKQHFVQYSAGAKLAALCTTPQLIQQVTWPFGPPGTSGQVQDFEVHVEVDCVMAMGNDIRVYNVIYDEMFMDVPVSTIAPEVLGRDGSGTILINVSGL